VSLGCSFLIALLVSSKFLFFNEIHSIGSEKLQSGHIYPLIQQKEPFMVKGSLSLNFWTHKSCLKEMRRLWTKEQYSEWDIVATMSIFSAISFPILWWVRVAHHFCFLCLWFLCYCSFTVSCVPNVVSVFACKRLRFIYLQWYSWKDAHCSNNISLTIKI
jgi:hypothetical protein